jgi:hypothetical protein
MKSFKINLILVFLTTLLILSSNSFAGSYGGGHGGGQGSSSYSGGHRGGYYGGGHRGGYYGGGYRGRYYGYNGWGYYPWAIGVDLAIGGPWYYPGSYYYPYYYPFSVPAVSTPQTYIETYIEKARPEEQSDNSGGSWYYCPDSKAYYPYVKRCPGGWQTVPAEPSSE